MVGNKKVPAKAGGSEWASSSPLTNLGKDPALQANWGVHASTLQSVLSLL